MSSVPFRTPLPPLAQTRKGSKLRIYRKCVECAGEGCPTCLNTGEILVAKIGKTKATIAARQAIREARATHGRQPYD